MATDCQGLPNAPLSLPRPVAVAASPGPLLQLRVHTATVLPSGTPTEAPTAGFYTPKSCTSIFSTRVASLYQGFYSAQFPGTRWHSEPKFRGPWVSQGECPGSVGVRKWGVA